MKGRAGAGQKEAGERRERVIKYMSESEWNETKEEVDLLLVVLYIRSFMPPMYCTGYGMRGR